jgi:hypothetical protein
MGTADQARENRLRKMAERQGLALSKSRTQDPRAIDFARYMLTDLHEKRAVLGGGTFAHSATLDEVEAFLVRPVGTGLA